MKYLTISPIYVGFFVSFLKLYAKYANKKLKKYLGNHK